MAPRWLLPIDYIGHDPNPLSGALPFCSFNQAQLYAVCSRGRRLTAEITREESHLRELGAQIASIKDADLTSRNDFIAAYAQVEPLEKEYDQKLQKFIELYRTAKERDSHRSWMDLQRLRGRYHPESWEKMSQIIDLVRKINETTKREYRLCTPWWVFPNLSEPDSGTSSSCR